MVLFFVCRIVWFSLLVATLLFSISSADQALVNTICKMTHNKTLCLQVLRDKANADIVSIGETAADAALGQVKRTRNLIDSLAKREHEPEKQAQYYDCLTFNSEVIESLHKYKTSIANKDFPSANIMASAARTDSDFCVYDPERPPSNLPPKLNEAIQKDQEYISIPLAVSYPMLSFKG